MKPLCGSMHSFSASEASESPPGGPSEMPAEEPAPVPAPQRRQAHKASGRRASSAANRSASLLGQRHRLSVQSRVPFRVLYGDTGTPQRSQQRPFARCSGAGCSRHDELTSANRKRTCRPPASAAGKPAARPSKTASPLPSPPLPSSRLVPRTRTSVQQPAAQQARHEPLHDLAHDGLDLGRAVGGKLAQRRGQPLAAVQPDLQQSKQGMMAG